MVQDQALILNIYATLLVPRPPPPDARGEYPYYVNLIKECEHVDSQPTDVSYMKCVQVW